jgi:hypothetical protein
MVRIGEEGWRGSVTWRGGVFLWLMVYNILVAHAVMMRHR